MTNQKIAKSYGFVLATICFIFISCGDDGGTTPKPRGYPRLVFPERGYQKFSENYCTFTFDFPKYAVIEQDKLFFDEAPPSDCWFNIKIPSLNAIIYCSYYDISAKNKFDKLRNDAFTLVGKHDIKADYIEERPFRNAQGVGGFLFDIQGPAACPFQFYMTDSTRHFMRGALYFNARAQPDSLAPVVQFLKTDLQRMLETFTWKN